MSPVVDKILGEILLADCREVMCALPDSSVDLVIADPPYGETSLGWDKWPEGWLSNIPRILKPSGSLWVFGSLRMFMKHASEFEGWSIAQEVIWEKHNGSNAHNDRFRKVHESIAHFYHASQKWGDVFRKPLFSDDATARTVRRKEKPQHWGSIGEHFYESHDGGPRLLRSVWCCRSEHGRAIHPTQKPEGIIAPLIEYSCPPSGVVFVPFSGSGVVERVAQHLGRRFVGCELNPEYKKLQHQRAAQAGLAL